MPLSEGSHRVGIGLKLSRGAPIESFRRVWQIADEAGFDHCWAFDHLATTDANGGHPALFEGWSLLAAMAEATTRVRIGLLVTGMVYRHPALLAKQAVTVDHLSGGRLEFGIGAGSASLEHDMFSIATSDHLIGRLSEGMQLIEMLWTQERASFDGRHYTLRNAVANPKPVQNPRPPVWIGAAGPMMLRLVARRADVWNWAGEDLSDAVQAGSELASACREVDRDHTDIRWSAQFVFDGGDPAGLIAELRRWHGAGFTELVVSCTGSDPVRAAEITAERILPAIRRLD